MKTASDAAGDLAVWTRSPATYPSSIRVPHAVTSVVRAQGETVNRFRDEDQYRGGTQTE
jgi:hypothetical protein